MRYYVPVVAIAQKLTLIRMPRSLCDRTLDIDGPLQGKDQDRTRRSPHRPNTNRLRGRLALNDKGFILTGKDRNSFFKEEESVRLIAS